MMIAITALVLTAAQDLGNVNPADWVRYEPMHSAARAQARRQSPRNRTYRDDNKSAAQTCREIPMFARYFGRDRPRVRKLTAMCREAGCFKTELGGMVVLTDDIADLALITRA